MNSYDLRRGRVVALAIVSAAMLDTKTPEPSGDKVARACIKAAVEFYPVRTKDRDNFLAEVRQETLLRLSEYATEEEKELLVALEEALRNEDS